MGKKLPLVAQAGAGSLRRLDAHRNVGLELVVVHRGRLVWQVEGRAETVGPGTLFFTLPWQVHGSATAYEPGHHWEFVVLRAGGAGTRADPLRLPRELGLSVAETTRVARVLAGTARHAWPATPALHAAVTALRVGAEEGDPLARRRQAAWAAAAILELVALVVRGGATAATDDNGRRMARVVARLRGELDRPWRLEEAAEIAGLAKSRFCEIFRRETGDTLMACLNRLRTEEARRRLRETDQTITRIAHDCGFGSSQYFASVFRHYTGVSARAFRDNAR